MFSYQITKILTAASGFKHLMSIFPSCRKQKFDLHWFPYTRNIDLKLLLLLQHKADINKSVL